MLIYKNILEKLSASGYNTTRLRDENIIGEGTLTKIRNNQHISTKTLCLICELTNLEIKDLVEYKRD